jgi:hypothetical protein
MMVRVLPIVLTSFLNPAHRHPQAQTAGPREALIFPFRGKLSERFFSRMVEAFSHLAEILNFGFFGLRIRLEAPLNKKLSGRGKGGDGCRNSSRMF